MQRAALYASLLASLVSILIFNARLVAQRTAQLKAEFGINSPDLYVELSSRIDEMSAAEAYASLRQFSFIRLDETRGTDRVYLVALGCEELIDFTGDAMYLHCRENGQDLSVLSGIYR
jgi:hypothetical protein